MSKVEKYEVEKYISELRDKGLEFLPQGIIEKSHTGMGATHMEIISSRNSIIVEPVKITAYSKVNEYNESDADTFKKRALYVGSEFGVQGTSTSNKQIKEYLKNPTIHFKKIICVADSLQRVVEELLQVGQLEDYFLLIDEIDSIQNDSSFRMSLEKCLDIYFMFNAEKRAVLTATPLDFTNEELRSEPKTIFKLRSTRKIEVDFYNLNHTAVIHLKVLMQLILEKYEENNGTLVIVLNAITPIEIIINTLIKYSIPISEISVLCSKDNQARMGSYYAEMNETKYPNRICFITSAYFTGYDIYTPYHLIIVTSIFQVSTLLSVSQIKQIIGRLRQDTHCSLTLLRRDVKESDNIAPALTKLRGLTLDKILDSAQAMITSMNCLNHTMSNFQDELEVLKTFRNGALKALADNNSSIIREKLILDGNEITKGDFVRSDFFIDSKKEQMRIFRENYDIGSLDNFNAEMMHSNIQLQHKTKFSDIQIDKVESFDTALNSSFLKELKSQTDTEDYAFYYWLKEKQNAPMTKEMKRLVFFMLKLLRFYSVGEIITNIVIQNMYNEKKEKMKDKRAFNRMQLCQEFKMAGKDFALRIFLNHYFQVGGIYSKEKISQLLQQAADKSNIDFGLDRENTKSWITVANLFLLFQRTRKKSDDKLKLIQIIDCVALREHSLFSKVSIKQLLGKKLLSLDELHNTNEISSPDLMYEHDMIDWAHNDAEFVIIEDFDEPNINTEVSVDIDFSNLTEIIKKIRDKRKE